MSNKATRIISLLLVLVILSTLTVGCSSKESETTTTKTENTQTNETGEVKQEETGGKTKLTMWHIQTDSAIIKIMDDSLARFMKDYPQYEVEHVPMQNDPYKTKLIVAMSSNEMPDVFIHWSGGPMISYVDSGVVYDITDFMNENNYKDRFLEASIRQATYKDRIWAVPVENIAIALTFYNKKLFEENGIEIPKTLEEFEAVCDKLLSKGITPIALANKTKWPGSIVYAYILDRIAGKDAFPDAVNRTSTFDTPDFLAAATKLQEWAKKGYFLEGFNGLDEDSGQSRQALYNGDAAMLIIGSWILFMMKSENPDFLNNNLGVFPFPAASNGKGDALNYVGTVGDNFYSVSANSKAPEAAFKAITYLLDDEAVQQRIANGKIPPLKGLTIDDPLSKIVLDAANNAKNMQLWLDQYLEPEMAEIHKDKLQELMEGVITPEQYNSEMEKAMASYVEKKASK